MIACRNIWMESFICVIATAIEENFFSLPIPRKWESIKKGGKKRAIHCFPLYRRLFDHDMEKNDFSNRWNTKIDTNEILKEKWSWQEGSRERKKWKWIELFKAPQFSFHRHLLLRCHKKEQKKQEVKTLSENSTAVKSHTITNYDKKYHYVQEVVRWCRNRNTEVFGSNGLGIFRFSGITETYCNYSARRI